MVKLRGRIKSGNSTRIEVVNLKSNTRVWIVDSKSSCGSWGINSNEALGKADSTIEEYDAKKQ